jgi:hypothetical protein
MGPPKKYRTLPSSYSPNHSYPIGSLQELDMVPNDDHAEEEESYGSYVYPDLEAC